MNRQILTGAIHIHTTDSDGTKSHEEVVELARQAGLEYLIFTDHMTLQSKFDGKEKFYDKMPVLIGYEHNDRDDCNHYLVLDTDQVQPSEMTAAEYVTAASLEGALGILAHPDEIRGRDARYRSYPWTAWEAEGFDGLEIWNQMSEWIEHLKFFNQIMMVLSPRKWLKAPTSRILRKWDDLAQTRKVVGIGSVDAHGFLYRAGPLRLTIFAYKVQFKSLRSHLILNEPLSDNFDMAKKQIYDAIRDCRVFISNYRWGEAASFHFEICSGDQSALCGGEVRLDPTTRAIVRLPLKGKIRLIATGQLSEESEGLSAEFKINKPGIYRVEVYRGRKGWIFSNHIRVLPQNIQ